MTLDGFITIKEIAGEIGSTHNQAWRFCRSVLGEGVRLGNQRLYVRSQLASAHRGAAPAPEHVVVFPLQPQPLPGSCLPGYVRPRRPPRRKHRRLVYDWLSARALEVMGQGATPCDYLCARFRCDGATSRDLASECRIWLAANRPGAAAETFPGHYYIDRYALRNLHGALGTPDREAIEAARVVSRALSAARTGARLTAGRAAARARRAALPFAPAMMSESPCQSF